MYYFGYFMEIFPKIIQMLSAGHKFLWAFYKKFLRSTKDFQSFLKTSEEDPKVFRL